MGGCATEVWDGSGGRECGAGWMTLREAQGRFWKYVEWSTEGRTASLVGAKTMYVISLGTMFCYD
jgi:hypothetical protein